MSKVPEPISTNAAKYDTGNPVVRAMIGRFFDTVEEMVRPLGAGSVLDAGCGEGETLMRLGDALPELRAGIDLSPEAVRMARDRCPGADLAVGSVYEIDAPDDAYELVLCLEVVEHLERPAEALRELRRVAAGNLVVSVPYEPFFRLGSLLRGKYVRTWGNHPEHVNHFNRSGLRAFLEAELAVQDLRIAFPWLVARCAPA